MAVILAGKNGEFNRTVNYFYADTKADMNDINPGDITMGSRCYIINTGDTYMANSSKEWMPYASGGGSASGFDINQIWGGNSNGID